MSNKQNIPRWLGFLVTEAPSNESGMLRNDKPKLVSVVMFAVAACVGALFVILFFRIPAVDVLFTTIGLCVGRLAMYLVVSYAYRQH